MEHKHRHNSTSPVSSAPRYYSVGTALALPSGAYKDLNVLISLLEEYVPNLFEFRSSMDFARLVRELATRTKALYENNLVAGNLKRQERDMCNLNAGRGQIRPTGHVSIASTFQF